MTDAELVTFLKGEADIHSLESCDGEPVTSWLLAAADRLTALSAEVERLKDWEAFAATELQTAKMATEQRTQQLMAAKKEVERLREALKVYADEKNWHCTEFGEYHEHGEKCCKDGWWTRSEHGYDVAREALKENL